MNHGKKNLIISLTIIVIIGVAGYFYASRDRSADILLVSTPTDATTGAIDNDLLSALRELKRLKLDSSIFDNAAWLSLEDFGKSLTPEPVSRLNPFAPLGSNVAAPVPSNP